MKMGKRKRDLLEFDHNKSDSEDEDFDPIEDKPIPKGSKKPRSSGDAKSRRRKSNRYRGSDIDDDDEQLTDSNEDDFEDGSGSGSDDDDDAPLNAAGRKTRKAAVNHTNYRESSAEDEEEEVQNDDDDVDKKEDIIDDVDHLSDEIKPSKPVASRMVRLKVSKPLLAKNTRRTRANAEVADDFVELSVSGRHAVAPRDSRSRSPEALARTTRASRASKGLKEAPEPIKEATQESRLPETRDIDAPDELSHDTNLADAEQQGDEPMEDIANDELVQGEQEETGDQEGGENGGEIEVETAEATNKQDHTTAQVASAEDDEDDDMPATRRTRHSRATIEKLTEAVESGDASESGPHRRRSRRLTNKSNIKRKPDHSSDFEPGEESDAEGSDFDKDHNMDDNANEDKMDSPTTRGRQTRLRSQSGRGSRRRDVSPDEESEIDMEELSEEARELKQLSRSRTRKSPTVKYHERRKRQNAQNVNYYLPPLNAAIIEEDYEEPAQTPSRNRRRGGAAPGWDRSLNTTFGPFGGGGGGSLLGGPWGTGATGGVESDSSDDEMMHRSSVAGVVGMTPTTAAPPGGLVSGAPGLGPDGVGATPNLGKIKDRKALADADLLGVDMNVDFSKVGGLQGHIDQLKEMVQLPLLYPELFTRFRVTPPRGVLFHGPPGTGKTLLARALANSVGSKGQKISFYMRKGADALSKWVGEAEKQLRLLFEEARRTQPSIIFFDEIDGLAPVRSSKQEQIHASIVSTLLALMDGMDGRGQVIVIGATNRPDNIDPALRRPGRFDREFYFPLPDLDGRRSILDIHTQDWGLSDVFKRSLAENTKGYGGADLRALCTEAALNAIQRSYPQIYSTTDKLLVDPSKIDVHASDFMLSVKKMIPSSERSATSGARPLPTSIAPLLRDQLAEAKRALETLLPRKKKTTALEEAMYEQFDDADHGFGREALHQEFERCRVFRPRFLISGAHGMGQGYLASAILHHFEGIHVQNFDLPSLLGDGRPMEQVIVGLFTEVRRHKPSVIYIPNIDAWYTTLTGTVAYITFQTMLKSIAPTDPVLVLATADAEEKELPEELLRNFFGFSRKNRMDVKRPQQENRMEYFSKTLEHIKKKPAEFPHLENRKKRVLVELPLAPVQAPKPPTKDEIKALKKKDHQLLNALKIQLQPIMDQINRRYRKFRQPVIPQNQIDYLFAEADPNYVRADIESAELRPFEIVKDKNGNDVLKDAASGKCYYNLETTTIEERLSNGFYARPRDFLFDIKALAKDAKNFGDKERTLKANELLSNVEVDVASIETSSAHVDWEALYQRQQQRAKEAAEKERRRKAMEAVLERVQSDLGGYNEDSSQGPVVLGEPVPAARTMARFQVRSPLSNGHGQSSPIQTPHKNGVSQGFKDGDVRMSGLDEDTQATDRNSPMGPPPKSQDQLGRVLSGMSQISQRSAVTSLPPGMLPSAVINEASSTKTSDPSTQRSSNWNTQHLNSNGIHDHRGGDRNHTNHDNDNDHDHDAEMPDTLLIGTQVTFSDDSWSHVQSQGQQTSHPTPKSHLSGSKDLVDPLTQQSPPTAGTSSARHNRVDGLVSGTQSARNSNLNPTSSASASQPLAVDGAVESLLLQVTRSTSGCSIEQLEQVNREMMDEIWRTRDEWNRMKVLDSVTGVFNDTMVDIESMQKMDLASQRDD